MNDDGFLELARSAAFYGKSHRNDPKPRLFLPRRTHTRLHPPGNLHVSHPERAVAGIYYENLPLDPAPHRQIVDPEMIRNNFHRISDRGGHGERQQGILGVVRPHMDALRNRPLAVLGFELHQNPARASGGNETFRKERRHASARRPHCHFERIRTGVLKNKYVFQNASLFHGPECALCCIEPDRRPVRLGFRGGRARRDNRPRRLAENQRLPVPAV